jgi:cobaltochelatase CobN
LPSAGVYIDSLAAASLPSSSTEVDPQPRPTAAIVFYRALVQAGETEPVDALCAALADRGLQPLPLYVSSLKAKEDAAFVAASLAEASPAVVLNATAFALSQPGQTFAQTVLDGGERPVLQVTFAGASEAEWAGSSRGLSPTDLTMNVVLPEVDGRIISRAVSFKEAGDLDPLTECRPVRYRPKTDRIGFVAELAARWARLRATPNREKRVGIVLSNYPNKDGRIANGVGLDAPASTAALLLAMQDAGYDAGEAPQTGAELMSLLLSGPTNAREGRAQFTPPPCGEGLGEGLSGPSCLTLDPLPRGFVATLSPQAGEGASSSGETLSLADYRRLFAEMPKAVRAAVKERWGEPPADPFCREGQFILPVHRFENVVIGIQPARGYNIDPKSTYHDPDLVPPHGYFAFYFWVREVFGADALVHMGKHGNLEWLPGKALALSENCFPEAALGPCRSSTPLSSTTPARARRRNGGVPRSSSIT